MKKVLLGALGLLAYAAGPAMAADLPAKVYTKAPAVVPVPVYNWTGFYVGLNAGGAWGRDNIGSTTFVNGLPVDNAAVTVATSPRLNASGFTGGGQIGYNYQTGSLVLGAEADFDYMGLRKNTSTVFPFPSTPGTFFTVNNSMSTDWLFTARGRIGFAANNWLFYATGGLAVTNERFAQINFFLPPFVSTDSLSSTRAGWTVGGGVEYGLTPNWTIKGEYLYADFGTVSTTNGVLTPPFAGSVIGNSAHLTTNIARIGVNYRWGGPVVARY